MKTKSIVYDLQAIINNQHLDVYEDYFDLEEFFDELTLTNTDSCKIRIDVGTYYIIPQGRIALSERPQIHIYLEGRDIFELESLIDNKLAQLRNYNIVEKYTYGEKVLNPKNVKLFNQHSLQRAFFKMNGKSPKKIFIDKKDSKKVSTLGMIGIRS